MTPSSVLRNNIYDFLLWHQLMLVVSKQRSSQFASQRYHIKGRKLKLTTASQPDNYVLAVTCVLAFTAGLFRRHSELLVSESKAFSGRFYGC